MIYLLLLRLSLDAMRPCVHARSVVCLFACCGMRRHRSIGRLGVWSCRHWATTSDDQCTRIHTALRHHDSRKSIAWTWTTVPGVMWSQLVASTIGPFDRQYRNEDVAAQRHAVACCPVPASETSNSERPVGRESGTRTWTRTAAQTALAFLGVSTRHLLCEVLICYRDA